MNRIVLIGNGFDLAHGLKTSYADFIDWYWEQWKKKVLSSFQNIIDDGLCSIEVCKHRNQGFWAYFNYEVNIGDNKELSGYDFINFAEDFLKFKVKKCALLASIMHDIKHQNWVDIERIYYTLLCESLKENSNVSHSELNKQLAALTKKLTEYLTYIENNNNEIKWNLKNAITRKLYSPIIPNDIAICASQQRRDWIEQLKHEDSESLYYKLGDYEQYYKYLGSEITNGIKHIQKDETIVYQSFELVSKLFLPEKIMLVNFNYTNIADSYIPSKQDNQTFSINYIHGSLTNPNSIIFGYGDEKDKRYQEIEDLNDNEYLTHIKSSKYLDASNYRKLLQFAESAPFQIYIMGHSCGNSDRTLLNTLFEHENCVSIKPFYYKKEDGTDNYTEIAQNISRNFKDKQALRAKVVPKDCCEPLPQASAN